MKIMYCIRGLHNSGGMERVLSVKANLLASRGHEVTIVVLRLKGRKPFFPLSPSVGIVDLADTGRFSGTIRNRLARAVREIDPDICVSLCGMEVYALPAVAGGRPCVAEYHFSHDKFFRKYRGALLYPYAWLRTRLLEKALESYDCMVTLTECDLPVWKRHCRRVERIFNPVTTPSGHDSSLEEKRMIAVGRLEGQKNFRDLVDAWATVAKSCPDWRLDIFGEGKLEQSLRAQAGRLGLEGKVNLRGVVKDIAAEYQKASALVMSSVHEGFPLALVEASSFGLPLISYDCPTGPSEIITDALSGADDANGFLVPVGDVEALADRICRVARDRELRVRLGAASKTSSGRFSPEVVISAWEKLFGSLCREKGTGRS
ncbi:MAG: glycosyltransferase family 4 protein [Candidatus Cryptobacteroides sp.]